MRSDSRRLVALLTGIALTLVAIVFVDRAASSWSHATFHGVAVFWWLTYIVDPVLPGSIAGMAVAGFAAGICGWRPKQAGTTLIAICLAVVLAFAMKEALKYAFGRTWPETWIDRNPSWIGDGAYGFHPFHGGEGWHSFPSGHMTLITASSAVLWQRVRRLRGLAATLVLLVAIGLFGADFHFISDLVAGTFLGGACGAGALALLDRGRESL